MDAFTLACNPGGVAERIAVTSPFGAVVRWSLPVPPPSERYVAALATAGSVLPVRCWVWGGP